MFSKVKVAAIAGLLLSTFITVPAQAATTCVTKSTNHGGYIYTAFKTVGTCTWDVPFGISAVEMLVVAGGGGGGPRHSGGGGAGGMIKASAVALTNISTLSITVGAGGAGAYLSGSTVEATNGSNSAVAKSSGTGTLTARTAIGGGKGSQSAPSSGGSGGGTYSGSGAAGTASQGFAGATGGSTSGWYGGGGGGAASAGTAGTSFGGGAGGAGATWLSTFDTTTATRLKLTDLTGYFAGGGGGGYTSSGNTYQGGAGGVGGGGNGGSVGDVYTCGRVGAAGCNGLANTGGGGGGAGLKPVQSVDSSGGAGGSGVVIFRYTITDTIELSNYGAVTTPCFWGTQMDYGFLFTSGTGNAVTKMRLQFAANTNDFQFTATSIEFWSNNAGVIGSKVGTLRPSDIAASAIGAGASVATRVGTFTGSVQLLSATQYWFIVKGGGSLATLCSAAGMLTQANSWAMVLSGSDYNMRFNGSYTTYGINIFAFEMTTGTPDYLEAVITSPGGSTAASASESTAENASYSGTFTADEWVEWSKSGNDSSAFSLSTTAVLALSGKNFEVPTDANSDGIYEVSVIATDQGGNVTTQDLLLTITDANDAPVITLNSSASTHSTTAAENQINVITYTATDEDTGTSLSWFFADNSFDQRKFDLNSSTGILTFKVAPDYEVPSDTNTDNVYKVNVLVFDGAATDTQMLSIAITNIVENSTINRPTISGTIFKGALTSITVATDTVGKVRFFINGKKIPTCLAVSTTGTAPTASATCSFKPAVHGVHTVTARLTPTDGGLTGSTSPGLVITVQKRSTLR